MPNHRSCRPGESHAPGQHARGTTWLPPCQDAEPSACHHGRPAFRLPRRQPECRSTCLRLSGNTSLPTCGIVALRIYGPASLPDRRPAVQRVRRIACLRESGTRRPCACGPAGLRDRLTLFLRSCGSTRTPDHGSHAQRVREPVGRRSCCPAAHPVCCPASMRVCGPAALRVCYLPCLQVWWFRKPNVCWYPGLIDKKSVNENSRLWRVIDFSPGQPGLNGGTEPFKHGALALMSLMPPQSGRTQGNRSARAAPCGSHSLEPCWSIRQGDAQHMRSPCSGFVILWSCASTGPRDSATPGI